MASSWDEDRTADEVQTEAAEELPTTPESVSELHRALAAMAVQQDLIENVINHLNQLTRTMSGYAEMLERHLSIQDDIVGSEYAVGVRGELEQLHTLLHHLRPMTRNRDMDPTEYQIALRRLKAALSDA